MSQLNAPTQRDQSKGWEVAGTQVSAASITPTCRVNRGDDGAWDEAVRVLRGHYEQIVEGWRDRPEQPTLNLILTMKRPVR